jgi:hypothetical protein
VTRGRREIDQVVLGDVELDTEAPVEEVVLDLVVLRDRVFDQAAQAGTDAGRAAHAHAVGVRFDARLLGLPGCGLRRVVAQHLGQRVARTEAVDAVQEQVDPVLDRIDRSAVGVARQVVDGAVQPLRSISRSTEAVVAAGKVLVQRPEAVLA